MTGLSDVADSYDEIIREQTSDASQIAWKVQRAAVTTALEEVAALQTRRPDMTGEEKTEVWRSINAALIQSLPPIHAALAGGVNYRDAAPAICLVLVDAFIGTMIQQIKTDLAKGVSVREMDPRLAPLVDSLARSISGIMPPEIYPYFVMALKKSIALDVEMIERATGSPIAEVASGGVAGRA